MLNIEFPGDGTSTMGEPTCMLRFVPHRMNSVAQQLQQAWKITTLHDGKPVGVSIDWRDVPFEPNP